MRIKALFIRRGEADKNTLHTHTHTRVRECFLIIIIVARKKKEMKPRVLLWNNQQSAMYIRMSFAASFIIRCIISLYICCSFLPEWNEIYRLWLWTKERAQTSEKARAWMRLSYIRWCVWGEKSKFIIYTPCRTLRNTAKKNVSKFFRELKEREIFFSDDVCKRKKKSSRYFLDHWWSGSLSSARARFREPYYIIIIFTIIICFFYCFPID